MRRLFTVFFFFFSTVLILEAHQKVTSVKFDTIRGTVFRLEERHYFDDNDGTNADTLLLYRVKEGKTKLLLKHCLYSSNNGGCGDTDELELGGCKATDSSFIFYTYWAHAGLSLFGPCGVRRQEYLPDSAGKLRPGLRLMNASLGPQRPEEDSLRTWQNNNPGEAGTDAYREADQKIYARYLALVGKNYHAEFVEDRARLDPLEKDVRSFLKKKIDYWTGNWDKVWAEHSGSICR